MGWDGGKEDLNNWGAINKLWGREGVLLHHGCGPAARLEGVVHQARREGQYIITWRSVGINLLVGVGIDWAVAVGDSV